jgi:hypothetical protein
MPATPPRRVSAPPAKRGRHGNQGGEHPMWRAFFLAVGIYCCILGAQCLTVERAILHSGANGRGAFGLFRTPAGRAFAPPDWAPWTLLAGGAVTILYSFTIPRRAGGTSPPA